jgi:hypothetical protein
MNSELKYLVHYYCDPQFLFKTITMYSQDKYNDLCNLLVKSNAWYCFRYSKGIRDTYYKRRSYLEKLLKTEFEESYYPLVSDIPIYFYIIPNITKEMIQNRVIQQNNSAKYALFFDLSYGIDLKNITFTLNDSFQSYQQTTIKAGLPKMLNEPNFDVYKDSNLVYPFTELENIHKNYRNKPVKYEIQIWDNRVLETIKQKKEIIVL